MAETTSVTIGYEGWAKQSIPYSKKKIASNFAKVTSDWLSDATAMTKKIFIPPDFLPPANLFFE